MRPGDNMMIHVALMLAEPGDVLVIDGGGDLSTALIGGLMRTTAIARKLGGIIIDGALRDVRDWADGQMPVFAKGHVLRGPSKEGPGEINVPVACAGLAVLPGDLVLGDADGVLAIPAVEAESLLPKCHAVAEREMRVMAQNATGVIDHARINDMLSKRGFNLPR
nr:RraA family protein [Rhizobium sp. ACO-34A]